MERVSERSEWREREREKEGEGKGRRNKRFQVASACVWLDACLLPHVRCCSREQEPPPVIMSRREGEEGKKGRMRGKKRFLAVEAVSFAAVIGSFCGSACLGPRFARLAPDYLVYLFPACKLITRSLD